MGDISISGADAEIFVVQVEDDHDVPQVVYNFVPLSQLEEMEKDTVCGQSLIIISPFRQMPGRSL